MARDESSGVKIIPKCILWVSGPVPFWVLRHSFLSLTNCGNPTPVLLPGKPLDGGARKAAVHGVAEGWTRLSWGSDTTERLHFHFSLSCIGEGNGNPLQYSCLENPRDWGAWWAAIYGVAQSRTRLKWLSSSSSDYINIQLKTSRGVLFLPPSDAYVRSFLYLLYTLIKLYYTKALRDQASSVAPYWILLLQRPRIAASLRSTTIFHDEWGIGYHHSLWICLHKISINYKGKAAISPRRNLADTNITKWSRLDDDEMMRQAKIKHPLIYQ